MLYQMEREAWFRYNQAAKSICISITDEPKNVIYDRHEVVYGEYLLFDEISNPIIGMREFSASVLVGGWLPHCARFSRQLHIYIVYL